MTAHCRRPEPLIKTAVIYMVLCDYRDGPAWAERAVERTGKLATASDIRSGELPRVQQVIEIEFGVTHGLRGVMNSRDVTEDFIVDGHPVPMSPSERLAASHDHERGLKVHGW